MNFITVTTTNKQRIIFPRAFRVRIQMLPELDRASERVMHFFTLTF